jgi:hypothetical protein
MRRLSSAFVRSLFCSLLAVALTSAAGFAQTDCSNSSRSPGQGRFTGQISSVPDGSTMQISYGTQTVTVRYSSSVTVCQAGQPASVAALVRGASVSVFGALQGMEIDAARIFVAGPPPARTQSPAPVVPPNS